MIVSVHQPHYLPWLGYFDKISKSGFFVFLDEVQYKHREFENRNKIRTRQGWIWVSVPVRLKNKGRQKIKNVAIDNQSPWQRHHLNSLKVWYGKAKFFKIHFPFFKQAYSRKWERLIDLNIYIINYMLAQFSITTKIYFESELGITKTKTGRIIEICQKLNADTYLSGTGGRDYLEEDKFVEAGIKLEYQNFIHPVYHQLFSCGKDDFLPNMSALDLLFNEGPRAKEILGQGFMIKGGKQ